MHSNRTLPLDAPLAAPLDARCGYALRKRWPRSRPYGFYIWWPLTNFWIRYRVLPFTSFTMQWIFNLDTRQIYIYNRKQHSLTCHQWIWTHISMFNGISFDSNNVKYLDLSNFNIFSWIPFRAQFQRVLRSMVFCERFRRYTFSVDCIRSTSQTCKTRPLYFGTNNQIHYCNFHCSWLLF